MTSKIRCADATLIRDLSWADAMITDPPYSAHVHRSAVSFWKKKGARKRDMGFDHLSPMVRGWIGYAAASVRRWSVIYSCWEGSGDLRSVATESGATYIRTIPWVRWSMPQLSGDRPPQGSEAVLLFHGPAKGKKSWNGPGNLVALDHKCLRGGEKHKAEKPLDQALDLVSWFSDEGETVFDPFAGHGTIGLACAILRRDYVGIEIDAKWAKKAKARVAGNLTKYDRTRIERWAKRQ